MGLETSMFRGRLSHPSWRGRVSQTKTLARASAPALPMKGWVGWKATSWMASSCFFLCAVISCTQVRFSSVHSRTEQSWPAGGRAGALKTQNGPERRYRLPACVCARHVLPPELHYPLPARVYELHLQAPELRYPSPACVHERHIGIL